MEEPMAHPNEPVMSIYKTAKLLAVYNNVAYSLRQQVKKDIAESLYHVLSFSESGIIQKLDKCKKDEIRLNNDIMWFSSCDKQREWKKQHIKDVEEDLGEVDHELQEKQVQEEILIAKESDDMPIDGAQQLNYVMESLVHRVRHGNNKRADEAKLYHEIRNVNDTIIEINTEDQEPDDDPEIWESCYPHYPQRPKPDKRNKQLQLKIVLSQLEKARTIRKGQLIHELDLLRTNIKSMERELEKISSLRKKAYKCAYKHGVQQSEAKSSYTEYQPFMTYVKELARRGDTDKLMQVCHMQLFEGVAVKSDL